MGGLSPEGFDDLDDIDGLLCVAVRDFTAWGKLPMVSNKVIMKNIYYARF